MTTASTTQITDSTPKKAIDYKIVPVGELIGHNGWVTCIASTSNPNIIVSGSRDKTLIVWEIVNKEEELGRPLHRLYGHEHFIEDVVVSKDGGYALSGSWDKTLRLWNLEEAECTTRFTGHSGDVLSVSFSVDNLRICSASRDKTVILWNTQGQKNFTISDKINSDWISCVAFSPKSNPLPKAGDKDPKALSADAASVDAAGEKAPQPTRVAETEEEKAKKNLNFLVYASWNGTIKKFDLDRMAVTARFEGHDSPVTSLAISPDASLCASGGKDGRVLLWDLKSGQLMRELELGAPIVQLRFNPGCYWLASASEGALKVWDLVKLEGEKQVVCEIDFAERDVRCSSLEWTYDGEALLCGFTDGAIRVFHVAEDKPEKEQLEAFSEGEAQFSQDEVSSLGDLAEEDE